MDDRTETPTQSKLEELREQGQFPLSALAIRCVAFLALLFGIRIIFSNLQSAYLRYKENFTATNDLETLGEPVLKAMLLAGLSPILLAVLVVLLFGFVQSKFYFNPGRISPTFERLGIVGESRNGFFGYVLKCFTAIALVSICTLSVFTFFGPGVFGILNSSLLSMRYSVDTWAKTLQLLLIPALLVLIVIATLIARMQFNHKNRMSRREREAELRD